MRITDSGNIIEKENFFHYCFERVDGFLLKDIVYNAGMTFMERERNALVSPMGVNLIYIYRRICNIIGMHRNSIRMYIFRDRNCYGSFMHRYDRDRCVRFDIKDVEYDFDRNNGLLMINGNLPKNLNSESFVVGDLRIGSYEFLIDCVSSEHFYNECFYFGDVYEY